MSDYNRYSFTIKEAELLRVLHDAVSAGCRPLVMINGMYYDIELTGDPAELASELN